MKSKSMQMIEERRAKKFDALAQVEPSTQASNERLLQALRDDAGKEHFALIMVAAMGAMTERLSVDQFATLLAEGVNSAAIAKEILDSGGTTSEGGGTVH